MLPCPLQRFLHKGSHILQGPNPQWTVAVVVVFIIYFFNNIQPGVWCFIPLRTKALLSGWWTKLFCVRVHVCVCFPPTLSTPPSIHPHPGSVSSPCALFLYCISQCTCESLFMKDLCQCWLLIIHEIKASIQFGLVWSTLYWGCFSLRNCQNKYKGQRFVHDGTNLTCNKYAGNKTLGVNIKYGPVNWITIVNVWTCFD